MGDLQNARRHSLLEPEPGLASAPEEHVTLIQPSRGWVALRLRELWDYRELLYFLVWRDVKVRYKQTLLGAAWAILQPLLTMVVFALFFGRVVAAPDGVPYPLFSFAALVPWTFFANGLTQSSNSLVGSAHLIKKVYFPRLVVPIANVLAGVVDFALAFVVLIGMLLFFLAAPGSGTHIAPGLGLLLLPVFLLLALVTSLGVGLWLAALNVEFRDVRYVVPFLSQIWLFATPIAYPITVVPPQWRVLYGVNPMVGVVEGFRWALLGTASVAWPSVAVSALVALALLVGGMFYFRRMEKTFADVV